ncbi:MAG: hypothetical protein WC675_00230 [Patescibacteria group bacterium]|jgi:hypothetical protein
MSLKSFLLLLILGTLLAWLSWGLMLLYFDPSQTSLLGFSLFYLSLFLGISGIIFLVVDWLKGKIFKKQLLLTRLKNSIRHAILFSILILGWLLLKSHDLLQWWNLLLFILVLTTLEFFCMSTQKNIYEAKNSTNQRAV